MILFHNKTRTSERHKKKQKNGRAELYMEDTLMTLKS
jgi:hypothetical protein